MTVDIPDAEAFLATRFGSDIADVEPIGAGAWSRSYGYRVGDRRLVVRFGRHVDDFRKDRVAFAYAGPDLPVPEVVEVGEAFGGYYAISVRADGNPLESSSPSAWAAAVGSVAAALEAMRTAPVPRDTGWGGWDERGAAAHPGWRSHLLAVAADEPSHRTHGWRGRLRDAPRGDASFRRGYRLLAEVARDDVPRSLVHADMMNRNVLVAGGRVTGIFDWGCSVYGDHLYELAWFEFWAPWHPGVDAGGLRRALEGRWRTAGYAPPHEAERTRACHLHIGLDHLAYNAHLGRWDELAEVESRMRELVPGM